MAKETEKKRTKRPTAAKRLIQDNKRRQRNRSLMSQVRTAIRQFEQALTKEPSEGQTALSKVFSNLDKAVKKGIIKKNMASRKKARLTARLAAA